MVCRRRHLSGLQRSGLLALAVAMLGMNAMVAVPEASAFWGKGDKDDTQEAAQESTKPGSSKPEEGAASGQLESAEEEVRDTKKEARLLYNRGNELFKIGAVQAEKGNRNGQEDLLKQAIRNYEAALELYPGLVKAQSNIGFAHLTLKDYRKAQKAFEEALAMDPNHLNSLNGLANTFTLSENLDQALTTFEKLTTLDPGNPQYQYNKGSVLQKMGRFTEAEKAYKEAIRLDPKDQRSLFNLATLKDNSGDLEQAVIFYNRAKRINISNPIGLESIRRLEMIERQKKSSASAADSQSEGSTP